MRGPSNMMNKSQQLAQRCQTCLEPASRAELQQQSIVTLQKPQSEHVKRECAYARRARVAATSTMKTPMHSGQNAQSECLTREGRPSHFKTHSSLLWMQVGIHARANARTRVAQHRYDNIISRSYQKQGPAHEQGKRMRASHPWRADLHGRHALPQRG